MELYKPTRLQEEEKAQYAARKHPDDMHAERAYELGYRANKASHHAHHEGGSHDEARKAHDKASHAHQMAAEQHAGDEHAVTYHQLKAEHHERMAVHHRNVDSY